MRDDGCRAPGAEAEEKLGQRRRQTAVGQLQKEISSLSVQGDPRFPLEELRDSFVQVDFASYPDIDPDPFHGQLVYQEVSCGEGLVVLDIVNSVERVGSRDYGLDTLGDGHSRHLHGRLQISSPVVDPRKYVTV